MLARPSAPRVTHWVLRANRQFPSNPLRNTSCATKQLGKPGKLAAYCRRPARQRDRLNVAKFLLRTIEFAFYHLLICLVDRLS
jgi:hypothetical protein